MVVFFFKKMVVKKNTEIWYSFSPWEGKFFLALQYKEKHIIKVKAVDSSLL